MCNAACPRPFQRAMSCLVALVAVVPPPLSAQSVTSQTHCARPGFAELRPLIGRWQVNASDRIAPGQYEQTGGIADITTAGGGCALVERYTGTRNGASYSTLIVVAATPDAAFEQMRFDSEHGRLTMSVGRVSGDTLIFEFAREFPGRTLRTWQMYTDRTGDGFRVVRYLRRSDDAERELTYRGEYRRLP